MVPLYKYKLNITKNKISKSLPGSILCCHNNIFQAPVYMKEAPRCTCLDGVLTLEAAVILPLTACFLVSLLFFFRVMQVQLEVQKALDDTGRKLAVLMCSEKEGSKKETTGELAVRTVFYGCLKGRKAVKYVKGGRLGFELSESDFSGDDVDLTAVYRVRLPVNLLGIHEVRIVQRAFCRKWTGWNSPAENGNGDTWVYITPTGIVYHLAESCRYLTLSITSVSQESVADLRNESGGKYYECIRCRNYQNRRNRVYITNQGDRYHYDLNCSGIKRTIIMIRISEAGERRVCSKCKLTAGKGVKM